VPTSAASIIRSKLDYRNSLYYSLPKSQRPAGSNDGLEESYAVINVRVGSGQVNNVPSLAGPIVSGPCNRSGQVLENGPVDNRSATPVDSVTVWHLLET